MKRRNVIFIICVILMIFIMGIQLLFAQEATKQQAQRRRRLTSTEKIKYNVVEEEKLSLISIDNTWSKPENNKSSRLIRYKTNEMISGEKEDVLASKISGEKIIIGSGWLTANKQAYIITKKIDVSPYSLFEIHHLNGTLLSTVIFNKPNKYGWNGPYEETLWSIEPLYYFDDGQYGGVDFNEGKFHIVIPSKNIYKEIPIFEPAIPLELTDVIGHDYSYNSQNKDMLISIQARSRWSVGVKKFAYVYLLIDGNGNVLWRREKPTMSWSIMSPDGNYIVLFTQEKEKDFEGEVEIILRNGTTVSIINTAFSVARDRFSEDEKLIGFIENDQNIRIYEVQTGKKLNTFTFEGFHPVELITINHEKNLLYVLNDYPVAFPEGNRYLDIYELGGSDKTPLWEYDMGKFDRRSSDYIGITHLSISDDGNEITAYSNGILRRFSKVK